MSESRLVMYEKALRVDNGLRAEAAYDFLAAILLFKLDNKESHAALIVSSYVFNTFLMVSNRYYVSVFDRLRKEFPNLVIRRSSSAKKSFEVEV